MKHWHKPLLISAIVLLSPQALAHDNSVATGLLAGLSHPLNGADHLIALLLAGLLTGRFVAGKKRAFASLLAMLGLGAGAGILLGAQAWVEVAIVLSIPVFFALHWIRHINLAVVIMSLFMVAHGWAHAVNMAGMNKYFILGFLLTSAIIMGLSSLLSKTLRPTLEQTTADHG